MLSRASPAARVALVALGTLTTDFLSSLKPTMAMPIEATVPRAINTHSQVSLED
jgi:hypothetical protein